MAEVFIVSAEGFIGKVTDKLRRTQPLKLGCRSEAIAPTGCPIMSEVFIVDKYEVAISDGENRWYMGKDKCVEAGQPFSGLF